MGRRVFVLLLTMTPCAVLNGAAPSAGAGESSSVARVARTWSQIRRLDLDSAGFAGARSRLAGMIRSLAREDRLSAAAAMMDAQADAYVNTAALRFFAPDFLSVDDMSSILWDIRRSRSQRVLLRTLFGLCAAEYRQCPLSIETRRGMVSLLAGRIGRLRGGGPGYGEERLLTHLCGSVLSRYAYSPDKPEPVRKLLDAMSQYGRAGGEGDFASAIRGWETLMRRGEDANLDDNQALAQLGHWDPLKRWEAARYLAERIGKDDVLLRRVWALLRDPRDDARAAAVEVFALAPDAGPKEVGLLLLPLLTVDRGTVVQDAAADALIARVDQIDGAAERLLDVLRKRRPGPRRTGNILVVLSYLADKADETQKRHMLELAVAKLDVAPRGALALLKSLGKNATGALKAVIDYHARAYRGDRDYIDRHVMPAITGRRLRSPHGAADNIEACAPGILGSLDAMSG